MEILPFDFQDVRISDGLRPIGFRFSQFIFDIEAKLDGITILACGEAETRELAMTKAIMELLERASLLKWYVEHGTHVTSNGWAAHSTPQDARTNAILELVERDSVLVQWYLAKSFLEITQNYWPEEIRAWSKNELAHSEYPNLRILLSTDGYGPSVTCLFLNKDGRGVSGHATKLTLRESVDSAIAETCRAAHHAIRRSCWKDTQILLNHLPNTRVDPATHAVFYAYHKPFPKWMFGEDTNWLSSEAKWEEQIAHLIGPDPSDFKFTVTSENPAIIGFAEHPHALHLTWGTTDIQNTTKHLEARFPDFLFRDFILNTQPHIVS